MNKETLEVIRTMESKLIKAVSAVAGEMEREAKPIASNCETQTAKALQMNINIQYPRSSASYTNPYIRFLRETIELLVATNQRIDKLEAQNGKP